MVKKCRSLGLAQGDLVVASGAPDLAKMEREAVRREGGHKGRPNEPEHQNVRPILNTSTA